VIGANWGLNHIEAWRAVPGVEVAVICTSRRSTAEAAARTAGVARAHWDAAQMLTDPTLDIIDVTPRPSVRGPLVHQALQAGKHVMQPLPFALDLNQAHLLRATAKISGSVAMVENLHRHSPVFRQAKALLEQGALGEVFTIHGHVRTGILLNPAAGYVYNWITDEGSGASALCNFGAHLLHVLTWLFGDVKALAAQVSTKLPRICFADRTSRVNRTADSAAVLMRYVSGATGAIDVSWCTSAGEGFSIDAVGERGRMVIRAAGLGPQEAQLWRATRSDVNLSLQTIEERFCTAPGLGLRDDPGQPRRFPLAAMCAGMADAVRNGGAQFARPNFDDAYTVMRVVEAAYESAQRGVWVELP
jgi:predicted dehydrogenase